VTSRLVIPADLEGRRALGAPWGTWLDGLPGLHRDVVEEWRLTPDGDPMSGYCSVVVPVLTPDGGAAVLKLGLRDEESEHEHLALRAWGGDGAVTLLRADPRRGALLLERLGAASLTSIGDVTACEVVAERYARLHRPALPQLRTVASYVDRWLAALSTLPVDAPLPRRLVEQALSLGRALVGETTPAPVIVHGDLHYDNVLEAEREPWLVIDPKPMAGDPHYEPAPLLWNRWEELAAAPDLRTAIRRRFHTVVDVAGLDEDRARDWVVVRMVLNAHWAIEDAHRAGRPLDADERAWITRCVAIAKAVQD
jgi:streptomycin 6-kinase